ncbi:hypothetical protein FDB55_01930 [Clostridium botulinum]|uniref:DUF5348 domain-containing protein n=1 Tax=Clostridium botulinum TaxID=1491 RepID=UPI000A16D9E9|nr:DUF5348 domain-containing protein [Clostridium botulinum]MBN1073238.1 hypothetical protein [Clostridium botulinum]MCS6110983.1 hypothetical protein [Clostridium botulinum]NFE10717.1 hypothetical protein [Clostridium botulinum]NFE95825.1 hypothetical protein [Clostridium botulinum]NFL42860.1 hypothetical protein [Clostridium botulinum]
MKLGILRHNELGRYEMEDGTYFTSGDSIEVFNNTKWIKGRIEYSHENSDYYFLNECVGIYIYNLQGVKARCN